MAVNKIKISANTRKVLNKTKEILGIQGENMKDVLFFVLSEKIDGTAVVEIELPSGAQSFVELTKVEDGYELPVKSVLTEQAGFVKFQLRILQNKVEVFKSEIFELEVKESLNVIYEEPDQYPTWLDKLENLQSELNEEENKRVSNEEERVNAEEKRKKDFEQIQKDTESAINNIKDLTDTYNSNAIEKTKDFNNNYIHKKEEFDNNCSEATTNFNDNAKSKYDDYNKNADDKISNYNNNHDEKIIAFNSNEKAKTDNYNLNATKKLEEYNSNDKTKTEAYNTNASTKLNNYNSNVATKENEYNSNAKNKTNEFNNNASEKLEEYNQNAESLINRVVECEAENERLRNDIKSIALPGEASGENIHLEDSSDARCELDICGNQKQETRSGKNLSKVEKISTVNGGYINASCGILATVEKGETYTISLNCSSKYSGTNVINVRAFVEGSYYVQTNLNYSSGNRISKTFVASNSGELSLSASLGTDYTDVLYDIQLEKGTSATDYEQYGASPSFAYPSSVKAVGDVKNILNMSNAKGGTSGGITCNMIANGSYTYKGTASSKAINIWLLGSYNNKTSIFRLEPGTYYIDGVVLFDGNNVLANPDTAKIFTFINAHDITGVRVLDAVSGNTYDETKYPIIAEIDHEIPWVPYNCGYAKVDIKNENIFNTENVKSTSEVSVVDNKNGVLELQGVNGFWKGITTTQKFETGKRVYVKCKYVAGTGSAPNIGIKDTNEDNILENYKVSNNLISCSFISKGITKIFFRCNGTSNNGNIKYSDIMFSYEDIDYVPNQEQSYLVDVQQEMLEGDKFVRQDEKWYEKHCWKKMLLNGTEKAGVSGTSTNEILAIVYDINNAVDGFGYSNCFLYSSQVELNKLTIYNDGKSLRVNVSKMQFADLEAFTTKLKELYEAGTPVIIYYRLAEPAMLECTEAQSKVLDEIYNKIHTYKNITNISAESSEVNPTLNIKYLKDPETEHNKLQAQIDEIKELLSTTETSAMLLNNMQTDLESEV